jgi:cell division protein FtsL
LNLRTTTIGFLLVAVIASSVAVVYVKHRSRALFVELQRLERERDEMQTRWTMLRLETSAWATHERVERTAEKNLTMTYPDSSTTVLLKY